MLIGFNFDHLYYPGSDLVMDMQTAREMVEFLVRVNLIYLTRQRALGRPVKPLYHSGVRYKRVDEWEPIPTLYRRGYGDCKNLVAALIAQRRFELGKQTQAAFRWVENADHTFEFHILCQEDADFDDPSLKLGMDQAEVAKFYASGIGV